MVQIYQSMTTVLITSSMMLPTCLNTHLALMIMEQITRSNLPHAAMAVHAVRVAMEITIAKGQAIANPVTAAITTLTLQITIMETHTIIIAMGTTTVAEVTTTTTTMEATTIITTQTATNTVETATAAVAMAHTTITTTTTMDINATD